MKFMVVIIILINLNIKIMSAFFGRVLKQVFTTFDRQNRSSFGSNFKMLKQLVDQITPQDLNIEQELFTEEAFSLPDKAPCTYVHIFQNNDVAMSVFILRGDYTMPLHDHPMMHGILKAISGKVLVQSYTKMNTLDDRNDSSILDNNQTSTTATAAAVVPVTADSSSSSTQSLDIFVSAEPEKVVTDTSESVILTPTIGNYHEITAIGGVAAFFDILSPPYEADIPIYGKRKCNFYAKMISAKPNNFILQKIPAPISYYCDTGDYEVPAFLKEYMCTHDFCNR